MNQPHPTPNGGKPKPELSLSVANPKDAPTTFSTVGATRGGPTDEQRAAARAMAEGMIAKVVDTGAEDPPAPVVREPIDSIEVKLPNGLHVVFGPPPGISLSTRIARDFPQYDANGQMNTIVRTLMCVREIDGKKPKPIASDVEIQALSNVIGDLGLDLLTAALSEYWPPVTRRDLLQIKKNHRPA
jgi:hypothetical protein